MPNLPEIDTSFLLDFLVKLLNTPSPTGNAGAAIALTEEALKAFPELTLGHTRKGALLATWHGEQEDGPRAVTA
ncbi:MAG: peptidase M42, partial [Anaerolineales bacterium]